MQLAYSSNTEAGLHAGALWAFLVVVFCPMLHEAAWLCRGLGELLRDGTARGVRMARQPGLEQDLNIVTAIKGQL